MQRGRPALCPYCGGRSINKGFRLTKTMGKRRLKQCKTCRRKFTPKNQKPTDVIEEKPTESCSESNETAQPAVVSESEETDKPDENPETPLEPDENSGIVSSSEEEWTS